MGIRMHDKQAQQIGERACKKNNIEFFSVLVVTVYWLHFLSFLVYAVHKC